MGGGGWNLGGLLFSISVPRGLGPVDADADAEAEAVVSYLYRGFTGVLAVSCARGSSFAVVVVVAVVVAVVDIGSMFGGSGKDGRG